MRDSDVRLWFHVIVWVTCGQRPVVAKLQSLAYRQFTGRDLLESLTEEERLDALREEMTRHRVLLVLDDVWDEDVQRHFNLLPTGEDNVHGSRVLLSTRVRGLLEGPSVAAIEVGLPSNQEATQILLKAAEMRPDLPAPREAVRICELCGRLPLALNLAGSLIKQLGIGRNWAGVPALIQDELKEGESVSEDVAATLAIRASVNAISGSAREVGNIKLLFNIFGLIPEDTIAPLDVLLLLFNAVSGTTTTLLHIRKWIKALLDHSLIIGHVDKPQVRAFTCTSPC